MHCKHCGALMDEKQVTCPDCGANQNEEAQAAASVQEAQAFDEPLQQEVPAEEGLYEDEYEDDEEYETEEPAAPKAKKHNLGLIALILAVCTLLGVFALLFMSKNNSYDGPTKSQFQTLLDNLFGKEPYTGPMDSDQYIVAECNGVQLTNQMFMYYYWGQFYSLYSQYGTTLTYMGLNMNKPFEDQKFDDTRTWADFFTDYALMQWTRDVIISEAVTKEGFVLTETQKSELAALLDQLETDATKYGYESGEDYLKHAFDLSVDVASYITYTTTSYVNTQYLASKYQEYLRDGAYDSGDYKDLYYADVRHVLIKYAATDDASKAAAKDKAEKLYNEYLKNPTLDHFIKLAQDNSADGSASKGGLIEGVYPGQMVENFDKWCFEEGRKAGDHGLIETEYGWHLMYYDGDNANIYKTAAERYAEAKYSAWEEDLFKQYSLVEHRDKITFRHAEK